MSFSESNSVKNNFLECLFFSLFIILLSLQVSKAQTNTPTYKYAFHQIKVEDGLSQSTIFCMLQDSKGFLWFGTANGLNRYDGYNLTVFSNNPSDSTTISDDGIFSLYEDKHGYIWVGTLGGVLNRYDRKKGIFTHYYFPDLIKSDHPSSEEYYYFPLPFSRSNDKTITSITGDDNGSLWIGTWGNGLIKYYGNAKKFKHIFYETDKFSKIQSNRIQTLLTDKNKTIWIGTVGGGLYKLSEKSGLTTIIHYVHSISSFSLSDNKIFSLCKDKEDNLWIGTFGGGLNKLPKSFQEEESNNVKFEKYFYKYNDEKSLSNNFITSVIQDKRGTVWIGTFGGGINVYDQKNNIFHAFLNKPDQSAALTNNEILSLMQDKSGAIWIGTHLGKEIDKLEISKVKFHNLSKDLKTNRGLNDNVVWAICQDDNSILWIGTYKGGLNELDRKSGELSYYKHDPSNKNSISNNHIRAITDDGTGNLWIGTYSGGLNKFNKSTHIFTHYTHEHNDSTSLSGNQVQSILIDHNKNIWIGTFGNGLNKLIPAQQKNDKVKFIKYNADKKKIFSISDDRIYCLFEDREGAIWVGTFGGGLNKFNPQTQKFVSYKNNPDDETSISDNRVMTINEDYRGNLWVGTYGGGLQRFDSRTGKFVRYNKKYKMNSSVIFGILEDTGRMLWLSTDNGLFKFNPQTEHFLQYDLHDGLQGLEYSGGAYYKSKKGEMFFGGINGLNYFYPDSVKVNQYIPPIIITSIKVFDKPLSGERDTVELDHSQNFFSFEFSALDYTNPIDNQYAYILEGFDYDWHYVDSKRRIANYTNLPPGDYIFRVCGSNNDGVWNNNGARVYIKILPPFWETWWFVTGFILIVGFFLYYVSTIRFRNLLAIEKLKSKLAADLHDNIGSGLTEISILSELSSHDLDQSYPDLSKNLKSLSEKARMLIDNMSDIVWMVNPQRDTFYHLILRLKDSYSDLMNSAGISFKTTNIEKFRILKLPMEYKQNIFLIFKEGINNSIKHSKCKKISLEANLNKDVLELTLKDDGVGFSTEKNINGNGIFNMKNRANIIGAKLNIDSSEDGTTIKFSGKVDGLKKYMFFYK
jgi:ligand-binding sensor domain-containing protein/two-component sensor histidine kinase